ncbi:hypothetical protein GCM10009765_20760 [Fodinicola feengrottensis]|uniref:Uncharacterized protein n=1 Tax=Fodinicola feengrottensis TaxID=435914 RepID=A0ABN2GH38_9ACTN
MQSVTVERPIARLGRVGPQVDDQLPTSIDGQLGAADIVLLALRETVTDSFESFMDSSVYSHSESPFRHSGEQSGPPDVSGPAVSYQEPSGLIIWDL